MGSNKIPLIVRSGDDSVTAAGNALRENVVPIFCVSSVSGVGLVEAKKFLHLLPPGAGVKEKAKLEQQRPEFQVLTDDANQELCEYHVQVFVTLYSCTKSTAGKSITVVLSFRSMNCSTFLTWALSPVVSSPAGS